MEERERPFISILQADIRMKDRNVRSRKNEVAEEVTKAAVDLNTVNSQPPSHSSSDDEDHSSESSRFEAWTTDPPFHVDISALKAFYTSITKIPIPELYESWKKDHLQSSDKEWKIKVGDTVAVHVGSYGKERKRKISATSLNHPFTVPWWGAEVVTIYRKLKSATEAMELKKGTASQENHPVEHESDFVVELRWMYKRDCIPGMKAEKVDSIKRNDSGSECTPLDEIFESDHVEEASIMSILAPIQVHPEPFVDQQDKLPHEQNGLPLIHYYCRRLWSVRHKSLAPIGSLEKRQERGMLHSSYMNRDDPVRAAFEAWNNLNCDGSRTDHDFLTNQDLLWKDIFHKTISKLNLGQTSSLKSGDAIIGREKEQEQIRNFLRSAIQDVNTEKKEEILNPNLFSLFVAGPPGTGKTASVCSVIDSLKREQAEGSVGKFDFVHLNGLEMRHPFDVYVQLWEAISENRETCSAPKALANLEIYLANKSHRSKVEEVKDKRRRIIILVMDEIDYLQTRKETVLYNIFDWPHRGYDFNSKAQLIVIGISNTLNLPEKLHVRMQSRLGRQRCMFNSYDVKESVEILRGKLLLSKTEERTIFHPDAITFAARKIASESGDIRKIFHLCKVAAETVFKAIESGERRLRDSSPYGCITVADMSKASRLIFSTIFSNAIRHASTFEVLLYVSLASLRRQSGKEHVRFTLVDVITKMKGIASSFSDNRYLPSPSYSELLGMLSRLGESRIIVIHTASGVYGIYGSNGASDATIGLSVEDHEILNALKDTEHYKLAEKHLDRTLFL